MMVWKVTIVPTDFFPQRPHAHPMIYAYEDTNPQFSRAFEGGLYRH